MLFTDSLKSLTVVSSATATTTEPSYSASFSDKMGNQPPVSGDTVGALTGATAVAVVPAMPSGSLSRAIKGVTVFNRDTTAKTITVSKVNNGTSYTVFSATLQAGESMGYDGAKWSVFTAAGEMKTNSLSAATSSPGAKNGATVVATEVGAGPLHQTTLTCTATPISIADEAGQGQYGGVKLYDFPEGLMCVLGAVIDGAVTLGTTGTIIAAWNGDIGLGTAVVADHQDVAGLTGSVLQKTSTTLAVAKVGVCDAASAAAALTESGARWIDGTATAADLFLNLLVDDDATHTAGTGSFTGTVTFTWLSLGDKAS